MRVVFDIIQAVPAHWSKEQIEFHHGGQGTYCMSNVSDIIGEGGKGSECMCRWHVATSFVEEASELDEQLWFGKILTLNEG